MKVEKISSNKAMIILTDSELASRKITLKDIKEGKKKAQDFFFEILEEAEIIDGFDFTASQFLIEVSTINNELFTITITKADCLPDMSKFNKSSHSYKELYTVSSNLYKFCYIQDLYAFINKVQDEKLYVGNNSLYKLDNNYYILFDNATIKKADFIKTFSVLSEYSDKYYLAKSISNFHEYAELLVKDNCIEWLQKI